MESLQPEIGPPGGESLSAFLDGELSEVDCAELIETVRVHPGVGRSLSRYSLIREVLQSEEWRLRDWMSETVRVPSPAGRQPKQGRSGAGIWSWRGAFALSFVFLLAVGLRYDGSRTGLSHPPPGVLTIRRMAPAAAPYGRVRSVSWSVPSRALRRELTTYWMLHAASISATSTMAYPRIAAYNYAVSGRGQRWRHRHP